MACIIACVLLMPNHRECSVFHYSLRWSSSGLWCHFVILVFYLTILKTNLGSFFIYVTHSLVCDSDFVFCFLFSISVCTTVSLQTAHHTTSVYHAPTEHIKSHHSALHCNALHCTIQSLSNFEDIAEHHIIMRCEYLSRHRIA